MAYGDMDPYQVLITVIADVEDANVRLGLAEAKMTSSGLTDRPGNEEVSQFIGAAMRYANVADAAVTQDEGWRYRRPGTEEWFSVVCNNTAPHGHAL